MDKVNLNKKDILIKLKNTLDENIPDEITFDNSKTLQIKSLIKDCIYMLENQENMKDKITIPLEEYKELLIIKGKYEESQKSKLIYGDGHKEDGTTILPQTDPIQNPIYKITCDCSKHIPRID